mmetsp:Transcript_21720/g.33148  ORF Transcript_21720/g.33148 Transcript_21720/m.33148 type:complete len:119 (+) Transcript_21720:44-400(+)
MSTRNIPKSTSVGDIFPTTRQQCFSYLFVCSFQVVSYKTIKLAVTASNAENRNLVPNDNVVVPIVVGLPPLVGTGVGLKVDSAPHSVSGLNCSNTEAHVSSKLCTANVLTELASQLVP